MLIHKIYKRGHPTIFFFFKPDVLLKTSSAPSSGLPAHSFSPFSTLPLQGTGFLLRALRSFLILNATSSARLASMVNENYVTMKRSVYRSFHIHCRKSNSGFNVGSPRATPFATTQISNTHATRYTLPITKFCEPNEW